MESNQLYSILAHVQKPSQYLGNEINATHKDFDSQEVRVVLVFPDAYEIGMSYMGLRILYDILNQIDGVVAERCFAPLHDMEESLRSHNVNLFSLESKRSLSEFDIIGISVPHELTYTNILNILDLAKIPLWQKDRTTVHPLIIGGGPQSYNPEPLANFFDGFALGDGEDLVVEIVQEIRIWKKISSRSREQLLEKLSVLEGMYIPSFFEPCYHDDGTLKEMTLKRPEYTGVKKRIVSNLSESFYPTKLVVPNARLVHDRIGVEIQRGCARSCRFCQAGFVERPVRQRSPEKALQLSLDAVEKTGMDEISLLSLSAGDYQNIVPLTQELNIQLADKNISLAVPATRTETLTQEMVKSVAKVRKTGFTIAPEAGSERMRRVINKGNLCEDLFKACRNAFSNGYRLIKFYYMFGLPLETDDDLLGITEETAKAYNIGREYRPDITINIGLSLLVPKPFTPFQWAGQLARDEAGRKLDLIKSHLKYRSIKLKYHDLKAAVIEGLFSRGDRRLSSLLVNVYEKGCRFDQWKEHFNYDTWMQAIEELGVDLDFYVSRERNKEELFPWDHLFVQMSKDFLWQEYEKAKEEAFTPDCSREKCVKCGVCDFKDVKNRIYEEKTKDQRLTTKETFSYDSRPTIHDPQINRFKLRVRFSKTNWSIFYGHLELMSILKRAILRNNYKIAYSEGFHPQIKMAMGFALSLGIESLWEYFDLVLCDDVQTDDFIKKMNNALPQGIEILTAEYVDLRTPSLYSITAAVDYEVDLSSVDNADVIQGVRQSLAAMAQGQDLLINKKRSKKTGRVKQVSLKTYLDLEQTRLTEDKILYFSLGCDE
ncbi:TIGR03960 family B12-binding radical SAM protein, partial [bacterium]|nr:TIGR03960 family B12-binding radical SAM protein [bacterium]